MNQQQPDGWIGKALHGTDQLFLKSQKSNNKKQINHNFQYKKYQTSTPYDWRIKTFGSLTLVFGIYLEIEV